MLNMAKMVVFCLPSDDTVLLSCSQLDFTFLNILFEKSVGLQFQRHTKKGPDLSLLTVGLLVA